ncbi:MAG TPA: universal stress protein [Terriglobia bacterium]|nr:universal stress protein [Terriglobia bacterium]
MIKFKRILFPTNLSSSESHALDYAISLALEHEATICLVHVVEDLGFKSPYILSYFPRALELERRFGGWEDQVKKRLHEVISPQLSRQINVEEVMVKGKPHEEILRIAKEKNVDLIVIPSHKTSRAREHHLGSTADRVVGSAPCAVLVIRQTNSAIAEEKAVVGTSKVVQT